MFRVIFGLSLSEVLGVVFSLPNYCWVEPRSYWYGNETRYNVYVYRSQNGR